MKQELVDGKYFRTRVSEEHMSLIKEPESVYFGHVTPVTGSASNIKSSIHN